MKSYWIYKLFSSFRIKITRIAKINKLQNNRDI